jgi:hypothetical protein
MFSAPPRAVNICPVGCKLVSLARAVNICPVGCQLVPQPCGSWGWSGLPDPAWRVWGLCGSRDGEILRKSQVEARF